MQCAGGASGERRGGAGRLKNLAVERLVDPTRMSSPSPDHSHARDMAPIASFHVDHAARLILQLARRALMSACPWNTH